MNQNLEKIIKIIHDQLNVDMDHITEDASFIDDLGADSIDIIELVMAFETEFGIDIPDEDFFKIDNVREMMEYITSKI